MKAKGVFVTGTDTGVGKTVIAAALLTLLRNKGVDAVPMKPIQTGCVRNGNAWIAADLEFCLSMSSLHVSEKEKRMMAPYRFEKPCSPHLASAQTRQKIHIERIMRAFQSLQAKYPFIVVEGAGGVLVPIDGNHTMLDLITAMALPVVLVSRTGLGTINHTLLSLRELRRAGLPEIGVVFNETSSTLRGDIESDNVKTIERMGEIQVLGHFPFLSDLDAASHNNFTKISGKHLSSALEWL